MVRTFLRLLEMTLPVGAVFFTHFAFLTYDGISFFMGDDPSTSCSIGWLVYSFLVIVVALVSSLVWGILQLQDSKSYREGILSFSIYLLYVYVAFPHLWFCANGSNNVATQIIFFAVVGGVALVAILTLIARCAFRSAVKKRQNNVVNEMARVDANETENQGLLEQ